MRARIMVRGVLAMVLIFVAATQVQATVLYSDDFNRPESTDLGSPWVELTGDFEIFHRVDSDGITHKVATLAPGVSSSPCVLAYDDADLPDAFTYTTDVAFCGINYWSGVAWNIQNANTYYMVRLKLTSNVTHGWSDYVIQVFRVNNGSYTTLVSETPTNQIRKSSYKGVTPAYLYFHKFTIDVTAPGVFDITVTFEPYHETVWSTTVDDSASADVLSGGDAGYYYGIYYPERSTLYDNFKVEVVPEPTTIGLIGLGVLGLIRRR